MRGALNDYAQLYPPRDFSLWSSLPRFGLKSADNRKPKDPTVTFPTWRGGMNPLQEFESW